MRLCYFCHLVIVFTTIRDLANFLTVIRDLANFLTVIRDLANLSTVIRDFWAPGKNTLTHTSINLASGVFWPFIFGVQRLSATFFGVQASLGTPIKPPLIGLYFRDCFPVFESLFFL